MIRENVHRLGVLSPQGQVYNILTQTRILKFVLDNLDKTVPFHVAPVMRDAVGQSFANKCVQHC